MSHGTLKEKTLAQVFTVDSGKAVHMFLSSKCMLSFTIKK
jgi:hypothetical protein